MARTLTESPFVSLACTHSAPPTEGLGELYQENGPPALGPAGQPATGPPRHSPCTLSLHMVAEHCFRGSTPLLESQRTPCSLCPASRASARSCGSLSPNQMKNHVALIGV